MGLVDRARNIILQPGQEWPVIAAESTSPATLYTGYIAPLAVIGPLATFVGLTIIGIGIPFLGTYRTPLVTGLSSAIVSFVFALLGIFLVALLIDALAPTFSGERSLTQALKVAAYSYTPAFVAGVLLLFPPLGILQLLAALYGLYLLYLGLPIVMKAPKEKALGYAATVVVCAIVLGIVFGSISAALRLSTYAFGRPFVPSATSSEESGKQLATSILGGLMGGGAANQQHAQDVVNGVAQASKDATKAAGGNDQSAQAQAGAKLLKSMITGGKNVQVVPREQLKAILPAALPDMQRGEAQSESGSFAGITGSKASALYKGPQNGSVQIEIGDLGNMGGLTALAQVAASMSESESDTGYTKNVQVDGRKVHEEWRKDGKHSELFTIVANRFAVGVTGNGVDMDTAVKALDSVDMRQLEALANHSGK